MKSANLFGIALLTVLAGCKAAEAPDAATPTATTPAKTEAVAPAAAAPGATAPASAPAPAATEVAGDGRSLCAGDENVILSCTVAGSKNLVSLCASKGVSDQSGHVYFAQGTLARNEYLFPADKSAPARRFKRTQLGFAGNTGGYAYSFEDAGRKRIFYSLSGERGLQEQGVLTVSGDANKAESALSCEPGSVVENEDTPLFKFTRTWDRDEQIDRHGLPSRN